jgi:hypothetical protein
LKQLVEFRGRSNFDGHGIAEHRADLVHEARIGYSNPVGAARRTGKRTLDGTAQDTPDGTVRVLGADYELSYDESVTDIHPHDESGPVWFVAIGDEKRRR